MIGYGGTRPVFVLAGNTPGFQDGIGLMVVFTRAGSGAAVRGGGQRVSFRSPGGVPPNDDIPPVPARSILGMSNIDFEIGDGNPAAGAIRFHVARHGCLSHMDFHIGSGLAAPTEIGNEAEALRFYGGRYGILTDNASPMWQFTLIDSSFEGQREAAIREHMAGLTLIRDTFRDLPTAIDIDDDRKHHGHLTVRITPVLSPSPSQPEVEPGRPADRADRVPTRSERRRRSRASAIPIRSACSHDRGHEPTRAPVRAAGPGRA